jgi:hypothetical protein
MLSHRSCVTPETYYSIQPQASPSGKGMCADNPGGDAGCPPIHDMGRQFSLFFPCPARIPPHGRRLEADEELRSCEIVAVSVEGAFTVNVGRKSAGMSCMFKPPAHLGVARRHNVSGRILDGPTSRVDRDITLPCAHTAVLAGAGRVLARLAARCRVGGAKLDRWILAADVSVLRTYTV